MQTNQVATKANNAVSTEVEQWGTEGIEAADIKLPKLLLMQGISDLVTNEKALMGDIVDSITNEKLADSKKSLGIIPIYMWKDYVIMEKIGDKFEFKSRAPYNAETANWREFENREYKEGGVDCRRDFCMNFLVMLEKDITDPSALPYAITFKRTSLKAGQNFANFFQRAAMKKAPPCIFTLEMGSKIEKGKKGSYYVPAVNAARLTTDFASVEPTLKKWYTTFKKGAAKIDDSDIQSEVVSEAGESTLGDDDSQF